MRQKRQSLPVFRETLQKAVKDRRLTLAEVSELAGVSKSVIHSWLTGTVPHDLVAVAALAEKLNLEFYPFLFGKPDPCLKKASITIENGKEILSGKCEISIRLIEP